MIAGHRCRGNCSEESRAPLIAPQQQKLECLLFILSISRTDAANRPYFNARITELERLSSDGNTVPTLQMIATELGHRTTECAAQLKRRLAERLRQHSSDSPARKVSKKAALAGQPGPAAVGAAATTTARYPAAAASRPAVDDEPTAVLEAWMALEALSPQTYRKPEDLAGGDRACVADLARREPPWLRGESSRHKRQPYYRSYSAVC